LERNLLSQRKGLPLGLVLLALFCAASFGAIVTVARATSYHTACVGHGFVEGGSQTDGSFFSRIEAGCSATYRDCEIWIGSAGAGAQQLYTSTATCNAWSRDYGNYTECLGNARVYNQDIFSYHPHYAPNWCG
jgi:hypothetical protein